MIIFRNKIEVTPIGRDIKHRKADFIDGTVPSWLVVPQLVTQNGNMNGYTIENNGLTVIVGSFETTPVVVKNSMRADKTSVSDYSLFAVESLAFKVNNFRLLTDNESVSIKLVNTTTGAAIGLYGAYVSSSDKHNYFRYYPNGESESATVEEIVGMSSSNVENSIIITTSAGPNLTKCTTRPKNIELVIQPEVGHFHVRLDDGVTYSYWNLGSLGIDWSGTWKFVVESNATMHFSSVEMELQQNI